MSGHLEKSNNQNKIKSTNYPDTQFDILFVSHF